MRCEVCGGVAYCVKQKGKSDITRRIYRCNKCGNVFNTIETKQLKVKETSKMSKIKLFTHTDLDGIGCAILAYLAFGKENVDVEYCDYNNVNKKVEEFVEQENFFKSYTQVFITDISISEDVANMIDILDVHPKRVRLFDHHATALELNKYGWCEVLATDPLTEFKVSGTGLFFQYLCNCMRYIKTPPVVVQNILMFVDFVNNYDTWRWKALGEKGIICKQLNDLFFIHGRESFIHWALEHIQHDFCFPEFTPVDIAILKQKQKDIDRYIEKKDTQLIFLKDAFGYAYGVVFAEQYFSELGNRLCELHPELDYVAMIDISSGKVSYRTVREDLDVGGTIAHSFGGGGHKKAAGSTFDRESVRCAVLHLLFDIPEIGAFD